jgi:hypothetical protein
MKQALIGLVVWPLVAPSSPAATPLNDGQLDVVVAGNVCTCNAPIVEVPAVPKIEIPSLGPLSLGVSASPPEDLVLMLRYPELSSGLLPTQQ